MSYLEQKIEDYITNNEEIVFEYEDYFDYSFPYEDDIPEAWYYSLIMDVKRPSVDVKKPCVDVYYKIVRVPLLNSYMAGNIEAEKVIYYYIRQRYVIDSVYYREFCSSMYKALGTKKFKADDLIGVIEGYHLIYDKEGSIGSIRDRRPLGLPCDYFDLDNESEDYENVDEE